MTGGFVLALAMLLDGWLGEPRWLWSRLPHPAVAMGRVVGALDQKLNVGAARKRNGILAVTILTFSAAGAGMFISWLGWPAEVVCTAILLAQKSLAEHIAAVADALRQSLSQGRKTVSMIVSRDTTGMDEAAIARASIESAAENLSDGVIAPAFWFLVGGMPGIMVYKIINTADSMIGYRNERYAEFGWAAARFDDLLNLIPSRLTAVIIMSVDRSWHRWSEITSDARQHNSPNAGWPEAAMARRLNVALAGPRSYDGEMRDLAWVHGEGQRDIGPNHVDTAVKVLWQVWRVTVVGVVLVASLCALPILVKSF